MRKVAYAPNGKATALLAQHQLALINELGASAFDLLTPHETAYELGIDSKRIPDFNRHGWLAPALGKDIGTSHQYYRWRVEFAKRYRGQYRKKQLSNP